MMTTHKLGVLALSAVLLASCSTISNMNPFKGDGKDEAEAAEKAGRIAMVSAEFVLQADPELVSSAVILPDMEPVNAWEQAGRGSAKVPGHVRAGDAFDVAWTWSQGAGSDTNRALAAPVAGNGKIYLIDAKQVVFAIDAQTGKTVWKKELAWQQTRQASVWWWPRSEGRQAGIASGFGFVSLVDANTGAEIWKEEMQAPMTGSPTIVDNRIFIASNNNEFYAMMLDDGSVEWTDQAIAESARVLSSPSPAGIDDSSWRLTPPAR